MAAPAAPGSQILALIHSSPAGTTVANWTLETKTLSSSDRFNVWSATLTGPGNRMFTVAYMEQSDGSPGRICSITDSNGVRYRWNGSTWFNAG